MNMYVKMASYVYRSSEKTHQYYSLNFNLIFAKDINHIGSLSEEKTEDVLTAVITN